MAIKPDEVTKKVAEEDAATLKRLESYIDGTIKSVFNGEGPVTVNLSDEKLRPGLKTKLLDLYREAGWSAQFDEGDSQRDGSWCSLRLSPRYRTDRTKGES